MAAPLGDDDRAPRPVRRSARPRPRPTLRFVGAAVPRAFVPVTVVCGLDATLSADVVAGVLLHGERCAAVYCDPAPTRDGFVRITTTDSDGRHDASFLPLEHDCLSCTMREATVRALTGLARTERYDALVVRLAPGVEPDAAARSLWPALDGRRLRLDTVVDVLGPSWLTQLSGDETVLESGIAVAADDDRYTAPVLAAGLDLADVVISVDAAASDPQGRTERSAALAVLAPGARTVDVAAALDVDADLLLATGAFTPRRLDPAEACGLRDPRGRLPDCDGELSLVRWDSRRQLHPRRLRDAVDQLADGVVRSSGRLQVAHRPELIVGWDSAGESLLLGPLGIARPGARRSALSFLGYGLDAGHIRDILDGATMTDEEARRGAARTAAALGPDPFPEWSDEPDDGALDAGGA